MDEVLAFLALNEDVLEDIFKEKDDLATASESEPVEQSKSVLAT